MKNNTRAHGNDSVQKIIQRYESNKHVFSIGGAIIAVLVAITLLSATEATTFQFILAGSVVFISSIASFYLGKWHENEMHGEIARHESQADDKRNS